MSRFRRTFLLTRNENSLLFRTESAPLLKGALLVLIVTLFLISMKAPFAGTATFRYSMVAICLIGFLIMGSRSNVTIDSDRNRIVEDRSFYFFRKQHTHPLSSIREVSISDDLQIIIRLDRTGAITLGTAQNREEAELWQKAVQDSIH